MGADSTDTGQPADLGAYKTGKVDPAELSDWWPDPSAIPICEWCERPHPAVRSRFCRPSCRSAHWRDQQKESD